jgi:hypothetical protein
MVFLPSKIKTLILKTPATDLHELIQCLSAAEKRYFRLFAARHPADGRSNYLRLFDAIAAQAVYDEAAIKAGLEGDSLLKHFAVTKRYLYDQILECLHQFHAVQSVEEGIKKQVHQAGVLLQKDLPKQSAKLLQQARRQIDRYELFSLLPEWLMMQRAVHDRLRPADAQEVLDMEKRCRHCVYQALGRNRICRLIRSSRSVACKKSVGSRRCASEIPASVRALAAVVGRGPAAHLTRPIGCIQGPLYLAFYAQ